ncbi:hypothetical protein W01_07580 [Candidatus Nitrotoga sp. AM1P]|nr:hypothetical protein W01_07580 [Candidatus Nitrotoga sp. AM1P]
MGAHNLNLQLNIYAICGFDKPRGYMNTMLLSQIMKYVPWNSLGRIFSHYGEDASITRWPYALSYQYVAFVPKIRQAQNLT